MAKEFSGKPGEVLTTEQVEQMLAYDDAGLARPDEYNDVVFDATSPKGTVYRVKTAEEKKREEEEAAAARKAGEAREERRNKVLRDAGIDPESGGQLLGVRNVVGAETAAADRNPLPDQGPTGAATAGGSASGATTGGTASRSR